MRLLRRRPASEPDPARAHAILDEAVHALAHVDDEADGAGEPAGCAAPSQVIGLLDQALALALPVADGHPDLVADILTLRAGLLVDMGRFELAEVDAAAACALRPDGGRGWLERAEAAYRRARFDDAQAWFQRAVDLDPSDAVAWHGLGRVLVWLARRKEGDAALARAAAIEPELFVRPTRIAPGEFDRIAAEALRSIPGVFRERLHNAAVVVEDLPDPDDVAEGFDPDTLGLYEGATALHDDGPERIVLYQRNHETVCGSLGALNEEIRRTMLHEVGHHFGMEDAELPY